MPAEGDERAVPLHVWIEERLEGLRAKPPDAQREDVVHWWRALPSFERFLLNKLLTGEMRVGVSQTLVVRALAAVAGVETDVMTHRLMGQWSPSAQAFAALMAPDGSADEASRPYPFCLAYPLEQDVESLGPRADWQAEWKWDGIRAQLIRRAGHTYLWSRGEEVITARFPEVVAAAAALPDGTVLDGEVLAWDGEAPCPSRGCSCASAGRTSRGRPWRVPRPHSWRTTCWRKAAATCGRCHWRNGASGSRP